MGPEAGEHDTLKTAGQSGRFVTRFGISRMERNSLSNP